MSKSKANVSVFFRHREENLFLLQILNVGKETDELKFIFNDPESVTASIYTGESGLLGVDTFIRYRPEITYHSDGSVLHKLVGDRNDPRTIYKNPGGEGTRRTPLNKIDFWEPVIRMKVPNYRTCHKKSIKRMRLLPDNHALFNGEPFEARIYLGGKSSPVLVGDERTSFILLEDVASSVDVAIVVFKSDYKGQEICLPDQDYAIWSDLTVVEVVERVK